MYSIVKTISLNGLDGYLVDVETDISSGLPAFNVVGLPDVSIKEAKERVRACIKNSNIDIPSRKILVNLAPADKRKEGTGFDLPIAVGILIAIGIVKKEKLDSFENTVFLGELSLDGKINRIKGILPMCIEAKNLGIKRIIVPKSNAREAAVIEELEIIPVHTLTEVIEYINGNIVVPSTAKYNITVTTGENTCVYTVDAFVDTDLEDADDYADAFVTAIKSNCLYNNDTEQYTGKTTSDLASAWKAQAGLFNSSLSETAQGYLNDPNVATENIEEFRSVYDYVYAHYKALLDNNNGGNFANRTVVPVAGAINPISTSVESSYTSIIALVGVVSLVAIGGFFFIRRKRA